MVQPVPIFIREYLARKILKLSFLGVFLFFFGIVQLAAQTQPIVNVRFANPRYNCLTNEYCLDVEFQSNTANQSLFGMNVRFFYDDSALEFVNFRNFTTGYGPVIPNPPQIITGGAGSGAALFNLSGAAEFVNGAVQLVDANAPPVVISTTGWTKLYEACFTVDGTPNSANFCPNVIWDLESNPNNGGYLTGDDGVVITVVDPSPLYDSAPAIENVTQFNWQYSGSGTAPYGVPNPTVCISFPCNPPVANKDTPTTNEDTPVTFDPLVNDTDPDNDIDITSVTITDTPNHGIASVNPTTGAITYTPNPGYNGKDTLIYRVCDVILPVQCDTAIVIITITPVNDKPVAVDDPITTPEDTPITVCVTGNDTDPDGDPLAGGVMILDNANHGTNVLNPATGCITYTPNLNYNGPDTIQYKVCDAGGLCDTAYVIITVTPVNDPPVAVDDLYTMAEDGSPIPLLPLNLDSDPDNDPLSIVSINGTALTPGTAQTIPVTNGTVSVSAAGVITFSPASNFNGTVTFPYVITDGTATATANEIITVTPVNDPPVAVDDLYTMAEDGSPITLLPLNLDSDPDNNPLSIVSINGTALTPGTAQTIPVTNGTVSVSTGGVITFSPALNFNGTVTFPYVITDGTATATANEIITVTPVNDLPDAVNDTRTTAEDTPITVSVLNNDTFGGDGPNTGSITVFAAPLFGTATVNNGGTPNDPTDDTILYTPNANYFGPDQFVYQICDSNGDCDVALVQITVTSVNDKPVAVDDPRTTPEDTPIVVCVTGNDTDPDGDPLAGGVMILDNANHGTNVLNPATGCITYTPNLNYHGPDTIQYKVCDAGGLCDTAYVIITVTPVNDPPVAVDDLYTMAEDGSPITLLPLNLDSDPDNDPLSIVSINGTALTPGTAQTIPVTNGTVSVSAGGVITFSPALNFNGTVTFPYVITDGTATATANEIITVTPVNDKPVAVDDPITTPEDTPITVCVTGNDTDPDGDPLAGGVMILDNANHGTNVLNPATGCITYTPNLNYHGSDTIQYKVCDAGGLCDTAYVIITVTPVNDKPVAVDDPITTPEDTPITVCVTGNDTDPDGDPLAGGVMILDNANHGTNVLNPATGCITYTPNLNYNGPDTIQYKVCDAGGLCDTAYVIITVTPVNDKPVALDDPITTPEDTPITVCVTGNDTDPDGDPLAGGVMILDNANHGTNVLNPATGCITYTPNLNYHGPDTIQYKVCDAGGLCDTAYVIITVTPVNDKPVAVDDPITTPEDTPITVCVTGNDTDPDGDPLAGGVMILDNANHGTNVLNPATGCITYTPNLNYHGPDTIQYKVCDAGGLCDTAYVIITVTPVNDPPIAVNDPGTTDEDTPITVCVLPNDSDPDNTLTASGVMILDNANHGTNVLNPSTGCVTYTPNFSFVGLDSIQYKVCDPLGLCDTAYVIINVIRKCATIETWVYLEGAAIATDGSANYSLPMRTNLNDLSLLPGQTYSDFFLGTQYTPPGQPYNTAPWNYNGTEGEGYDSDGLLITAKANYPSTVVDWVLVSLRETADGAGGPACQAAALLHKDGTIEFIDEFKCCGMDLNKSYYVVIEHRNHLIVMSHVPVPVVNGKISYDFRNQQSYINDPFGFGSFSGQKQIQAGKYAMLAGNGNQTLTGASDTDINFDDRTFWETLNGLIAKYRNSDYNLNGDTNFNDRRVWELNNGKFTSVPRN